MSFSTVNPTTGELAAAFPLQGDEEIFEALVVADRRYREDWRLRTVAERAEIVGRGGRILRESATSTRLCRSWRWERASVSATSRSI
ncbi:aldehyde dehydrogenase family protein [Pseudonocardia sp. MH-G8]|uniref:aldehyde dehydrogenase family protein n=1 Tax=Pseudonocardia sp. MH-G8 TaxID=1854588 RepID=UPI0018E95CD9